MTIPTHILLGAIIGKVTGNYSLAIGASVIPDLDHLASYVKSGVIRKSEVFWNTITAVDDPYGDQRGILHNFFLFLILSVLFFVFIPKIAVVLIIGWFGHIILDALDKSDYWPFYPNKKINLRGVIKYASIQEFVFFLALLVVFLVL